MKKQDKFLALTLVLSLIFLVTSCKFFEAIFNPQIDPPPIIGQFPTCEELKGRVDEKHYILEIRDSVNLSSLQSERNVQIQRALGELLSDEDTIVVMDSIYKSCMCRLFLMEVIDDGDGIKASDRTAQAKSRLEQQDDGSESTIIKNVDNNYIFPVGPTNPLVASSPVEAIDAPPYYTNTVSSNSKPGNIKVAITDSGIDYQHDSLKNFIWVNNDIYNGYDDDGNCIEDDRLGRNFLAENNLVGDSLGHGTHVAGIVTKRFNNNSGYDTILNSLELMNLKILNADSSSLFGATCAIHYAIDKDADIINASWGYYAPDTSIILEEAVSRAKDSSIFIVAAAGNHNKNIDECPHWPASFSTVYNNVITVAAMDGNALADFSNYGQNTVTIAAQGTDINSTFIYKDTSKYLSGTSMAAPAVSRYIAWRKFNGENFDQIRLNINNLAGLPISNINRKPIRRNNAQLKPAPPY